MELIRQIAETHNQRATATKAPEIADSDDAILAAALEKAKANTTLSEAPEENIDDADSDTTDKGLFGGRQIEFKQDVYRIPDKPSGDVSQPIGLLTQSDLNNYVLFKKGDRLSFKWKGGTSGQAVYDVVRNGDITVEANIEWSDPLIKELEDEGAISLLSV